MSTLKQHFQRRFLLDVLPADLKLSDPHLQITEYLPESDEFLIRRIRDTKLRLAQHLSRVCGPNGGVRHREILNVRSEEVNSSTVESRIGSNDSIELRFNRYQSKTGDVTIFVDVFLGTLNGGVITATLTSENAGQLRDVTIEKWVELAPYYNYRLIVESKAGIRGEKR
jgi:hypothetical protein